MTLLKCPQSTGLLNLDGGCLVEATNSNQQVTAGIIVVVVVGLAFGFVVLWSYKHAARVLESIHSFVTGVGGVVVRFALEIVDVVSDIQALVDLFLYDLAIAEPTLVRAMYVTLLALSAYPSVAVLQWSVYSIHAQWKRVLARRVIFASDGKTRKQTQQLALRLLSRHDGNSPDTSRLVRASKRPSKWTPSLLLQSMRTSRKLQVHATDSVQQLAITPSSPSPSRPNVSHAYDVATTAKFLDEQEKLLLVELEYQHVRANYMKRALARLVTEDGLLLIFNLYIYLTNHSNESFAKSRFRSSLELSIMMSVLHFGSQVQNITTWLQTNKIAEIVDQLEKIRALRLDGPLLLSK